VDGARGLSLDQLTANAPTPTTSYPAEDIMARVIRSEVTAGRIVETDDGGEEWIGRGS